MSKGWPRAAGGGPQGGAVSGVLRRGRGGALQTGHAHHVALAGGVVGNKAAALRVEAGRLKGVSCQALPETPVPHAPALLRRRAVAAHSRARARAPWRCFLAGTRARNDRGWDGAVAAAWLQRSQTSCICGTLRTSCTLSGTSLLSARATTERRATSGAGALRRTAADRPPTTTCAGRHGKHCSQSCEWCDNVPPGAMPAARPVPPHACERHIPDSGP